LATPVPPGCFTAAAPRDTVISVDKKTFSNAPRFPKANWTREINASRLVEVYQYFGKDLSGTTVKPTGFTSAASLRGVRLVSQTSEPLGQVEDVMVDLPAGRVVFLVIKPAVGPDPETQRYVLPPGAVQLDTAGSSLALRASLADFVAGPSFQKDFPANMTDPKLAADAYEYYAQRTRGVKVADPAR